METSPVYPIGICEYKKCGKTFIKKNPRRKCCSRSCSVGKSIMGKKEREMQGIQDASASFQSSLAGVVLSDEQFQELKKEIKEAIVQQIKEVSLNEATSTSSLDLMNVVESGLGYVAGKAAISLMGKSPLEQKVDYLIQLQFQSQQGRASTINKPNTPGIQPVGMGIPGTSPALGHKATAQKRLHLKTPTSNPITFGMGIVQPAVNKKIDPPSNPFFQDESIM